MVNNQDQVIVQQELPSYKLLLLHALKFRVIISCKEQLTSHPKPAADLIQLLLTDLNDQADYSKMKPVKFCGCGQIKLLLASGKIDEAIEEAFKQEHYGLSYYLCVKYNRFENKELLDKIDRAFEADFETYVPGILGVETSDGVSKQSVSQRLAQLLLAFQNGQELDTAGVMECIDADPKLLQICLVICGVPLVF